MPMCQSKPDRTALPDGTAMSDRTAMSDALQLTRSGRLAEATALIQRALGGPSAGLAEPILVRPPVEPKVLGALASLGALPSLGGLPALGGLPGLGELPAPHNATPSASRPYRLHVPSELPPGPRPLLVLLHGGTQDGASFADATGFDALADDHGFIALYPEQITAANPMRYWNWFNRADQQRGAGEPAILVRLVAQIAAEHEIDESHVFVAGFSAGAAMASVLGATYPEVFAGIGVHSGLAHGAATDMISAFAAMRHAPPTPPVGALPVIVIHGDADPTVNVSNAAAVLDQFAPSGATRRTLREQANGREVERTLMERDGQTVAERLIIRGAGHTWSGGRAGGSYADPSGPSAAVEMVRFFGLDRERRTDN